MDTYEKKYKEALERAKKLYEQGTITESLDYIFPDLAESEDEKIRKELIAHCRNIRCVTEEGGEGIAKWLTWLEKQGQTFTKKDVDDAYLQGISEAKNELEKQGEQKLANKVETKFKVGDWVMDVTDGKILHINKVRDYAYYVTNLEGASFDTPRYSIETRNRLWTIKDARDGDLIYVSTEEKGIQAIFHEYKNGIIFFHCYLCYDFAQGGYMPIGSVELVYPLQKTHYNRFFEKMHEAGYMWDSESKQLLFLKAEPRDTQNPTWSEEDEHNIQNIDSVLFYDKTLPEDTCVKLRDFLKSLKQRIGG